MAKVDLDVVIAGDFRFPGGTSAALAHELRVLQNSDLRIGLWHFDCDLLGLRPSPRHAKLAEAIKRSGFPEIDPDTSISAHVLVLHNPTAIRLSIPRALLRVGRTIIVAHQVPRDCSARFYYDPWWISRATQRRFGSPVLWAPISEICRSQFQDIGLADRLTPDNWTNFVFPEEWAVARDHLVADRPVIGRHGRPQPDKWPAKAATILAAYPDDPRIIVRVLGADSWLRSLLGGWPTNWEVLPFNAVPPREFLAKIDFFVYFHHEDLIEAFGRTVIEAAASGAICILPPHFRDTFGELAFYCQPSEVQPLVLSLAGDSVRCRRQRKLAYSVIARRFGPATALRRYQVLLNPQTEEMRSLPRFQPKIVSLKVQAAVSRMHMIWRPRAGRFFRVALHQIGRRLGWIVNWRSS